MFLSHSSTKFSSVYKFKANAGYLVDCLTNESEESDKSNVIVESLYNFKGGLIGSIVPADVDVISTTIGVSKVAL